ncbi:MAG: hypothetical protein ACJATI_005163 [Halioglobus sp.]|jgi:hypothetical protein
MERLQTQKHTNSTCIFTGNCVPFCQQPCSGSGFYFDGETGQRIFKGEHNWNWILQESQVGNPTFIRSDDLPECAMAYRIEVSSIYDPTCKRVIYSSLRTCANHYTYDDDHQTNVTAEINSQISYPELGSITVTFENRIYNWEGLFLDAEMVGPTGELFEEYEYSYDWYYQGGYGHLDDKAYVTFNGMTEPGEYCITLSNNCGQSDEVCITLEECPSVMSFYTIDKFSDANHPVGPLYTSVFPVNRSKPANYIEYDNAYMGNGRCIDIENCYSENDPYTSDCNDPNDEKTIFYYDPDDDSSPCSGGTVSVYQYDYTSSPLRSVLLIDQFDFNAEAAHSFDWVNNETEYQPGANEEAIDYAYSGINKEMDEAGFDGYSGMSNGRWRNKYICESGTYCLFESEDIFGGIFTDEYILMTTCTNWTTICDIWPNSEGCESINCENINCPAFELLCPEEACPSCDDGIQNQGEIDVDCGGPFCAPCSDCWNNQLDGNETWVDCGPTCPCSNTCGNGIQDGCETGVDCGGKCCAPCGNSGGDPGSEFECVSDWDCPAIGYECVNGECVQIECDPEAFFSDCNLGETCLGNVCVIECDVDFDCPIGYVCGPDGICVEEDDDPPTDDCVPECEAPDYECFNGNCIYVGDPISNCSSASPCPSGQYCDDGDCTNCPIITYDVTYGNNDDCQFEIFLYSDHHVLLDIKVYQDITILLDDYNLALTNWNPLQLSYQVPNDCNEHSFSFEFTFEDCSINTIELESAVCNGPDCFTNNDSNTNSLASKTDKTDWSESNVEIVNENNTVRTSTQGLIRDEIKCYPNPTGGSVNLFSADLLLDRVEVYDVVGQKQIEFNFVKKDHLQELDIYQLNAGIYFLKVFDSNNNFQLIKIVKS